MRGCQPVLRLIIAYALGRHRNTFGVLTDFISHAWDGNFGDLVNAIRLFDDPQAYFFIDIFAVNQWDCMTDLNPDGSRLGAVVGAATSLRIIVDTAYVAMERAWCVFEFMVACKASSTLIAVFFTKQPMMSDALNMIDNFDCQTCKASFPADERMIKAKLIKMGVARVNSVVKRAVALAAFPRTKGIVPDDCRSGPDKLVGSAVCPDTVLGPQNDKEIAGVRAAAAAAATKNASSSSAAAAAEKKKGSRK